MHIKIQFIFLVFISSLVFGREISIQNTSFKEALEAKSKIYFEMESTKAGFITTGFTGVVKNAKITFEENLGSFNNVRLSFKVNDLDTDVSARNEKMYNLCFESEKFPELEVQFDFINIPKGQAVGVMKLRGESFPVTVNYNIENNLFKFDAKLSLKELKIPDPSIFIAKVKDEINLVGEIELK